MITEIQIGPFVFEYDEKHKEMYVNYPEEHIGTVHSVWPEKWQEFIDSQKRD